MGYTAVTVEGGLFPSNLLDRIATGEAEGQRPADFGLDGSRRLVDEIQSAFSDARSFWDAFQRRLERSRESRTTITREDWVIPFLELLGFYKLQLQRASLEAGGESFFISHLVGEDEAGAPPVHIVAIDQDLDRRNGARRSPHALVQDYLNRSDALWGIVTNGRRLRLLRDSARLAKPTYVEFDLEGMIASNLYSEFVLLYRLLHASRFPRDGAAAHECLLERYYQQGIDEGGRVREKLRDGVEEALKILGTAFLAHPDSGDLREKFARGQLDAPRYYRQLLRLVYRLLFLMAAEERRLIFPPDADTTRQAVYAKYYSVTRLRDRADRYFAGDDNGDLWLGLRQTFRLFRDHDAAQKLGLAALDGELFGPHACEDLEGARCTNEALLCAIRCLSTFVDDGGVRRRRASGVRRRVNYAGLDVEEFGSVYESLLDYHPQVTLDPSTELRVGPPRFDLVAGSERKQTGSYYTPPELVRELIESALVPVMEEKLRAAKTRDEKIRALLDLRVCDPAAGSGHFLLAAARRIARELAKVRSGEDEPAPDEYRRALRDVIRQCVYAVDKNPLAVDLCKVALWIEGHNAGLPLSFLDHHVKCGDSLVGVFDLKVLEEGIPDEAYKPVTGDDKTAARYYRDRNRRERRGQTALALAGQAIEIPDELAETLRALGLREERRPEDVHAKEELYDQLRARGSEWWKLKVACDLWTYAFFAPMPKMDGVPSALIPTTDAIRRHLLTNSAHPELVGTSVGYSEKHPFFHWPLEFPEVLERGGFDVVLGNPPYIESAALVEEQPGLRKLASARFRSASGNWDAYVLFVELAALTTAPGGRQAMVTPTRMLASDYCAELQALLLQRRPIVCMDFSELKFFRDATISVAVFVVSNRAAHSGDMVSFIRYGDEVAPLRSVEASIAELRSLPPGYICFPLLAEDPSLLSVIPRSTRLGNLSSLTDGATTAEAYEIRPLVREGTPSSPEDTSVVRLVNTGTIDPYRCLWGIENIAYLGFRGRYPVVDRSSLARVAPRRVEQADAEKVVVAGLSRRIEAAVAPAGILCGKSTVVVVPHRGVCPFALAVVLNSEVVGSIYKSLFGLRVVQQDWMNIGPRQLELLPVPPPSFLAPCNFDGPTPLTRAEANALLLNEVDALRKQVEHEAVLSRLGRTIHTLLSDKEGADVGTDSEQIQAFLDAAERCTRVAYALCDAPYQVAIRQQVAPVRREAAS